MAEPGEASETTRWRRAAKFYRRSPGVPWLIALVVVPLMLGAIGYGLADRSREINPPSAASPAPTGPNTPVIPPVWLSPVSITRNGNDITLRGEFPNNRAKNELLDAVIGSIGHSANVIDDLAINPDVESLDFSDSAALFNAAASIPDFSLLVNGDTIRLAGTAASMDQVDTVEQAAEDTWPDLNIVDTMEIGGPVTPTGSPGGR
jgi:peptidoglycan-binding protein ArfA